MRIKSLHIKDFKRFTNLKVGEIPETAKLVVLVGPNGSGKSSLFEVFNFWISPYRGAHFQLDYHSKVGVNIANSWDQLHNKIAIEFHGVAPNPRTSEDLTKKAFYIRSAYRHEPDFTTQGVQRVGETLDDPRKPQMLISHDTRVSDNYQRIVADTVAEVYRHGNDAMPKGEIRERIIGKVRHAMKHVFHDLQLDGPGDPMVDGTFFFEKGVSHNWKYKNLSGGEKAAFDLLLDFILKTQHFNNTIFCIDEPELHMHTRLQGKLLEEMYSQLPENCQLWIATHSVGMMRQAMRLHKEKPESVIFLNFEGRDFDVEQHIVPEKVSRQFWKKIFNIALDDLADLVAPSEVIFCEGAPVTSVARRNTEFDAKIYRAIFSGTHPDVEFISLGGTNEVEKDAIKISTAIGQLFTSIKMLRLFDRDDRSDEEIKELQKQNIRVLSRRDVENYLWDDEILKKLCIQSGKPDKIDEILETKKELLEKSKARGNPSDDIKSVSSELYVAVKRKLDLTQCGNNKEAFCVSTLTPLITPDTAIFKSLTEDIFI